MLSRIILLAPISLGVIACTAHDDASPGSGGVSASSGAGTLSVGGSGAPAEELGSGAPAGGAGSPGGGASSSGSGVAGGGGANAGAMLGGTGSGGSSAGRPATTGGSAGTGAAIGGMSAAGLGSSGAAQGGAGGSPPTSGLPSVSELFPAADPDGSLDGRLLTMPCTDNSTAEDCVTLGAYYRGKRIDCSGGALDVKHTYPVAGTPGELYRVTLHVYGIVEAKNYGPGVTREASTRPGTQDAGSTPTPWATAPAGHSYPASTYNTYEIRVDDDQNREIAVYYLNADTSEGHWTYVLDYSKQIRVVGGGRVRVRTYDQNCKQIKNCGNPNKYPCEAKANARILDVTAAEPAPANAPAAMGGLSQPGLIPERNANNAGQWLLIDVVSVDATETP